MPRRTRISLAAAAAAAMTGHADAQRLLGMSHADQTIWKLDVSDGELIKFPGHPILWLGGLDVDAQGALYYQASQALYRIDLHHPGNDELIASAPPGEIFESFEIVENVGYTCGVFSGIFYEIDLATGAATAIGTYGAGGADRVSGLASTDAPGPPEPLRLYGMRPFLDDVIEIDPASGRNLGVVAADPLLGSTNFAYGASAFWWVQQGTLYKMTLTAGSGFVEPVIEDLDVQGVDGLTFVDPEPVITTRSVPPAVIGTQYGPVPLEHEGGAPGILWVALSDGYTEVPVGASEWQMVGVAQGLFGDDVAMTYAMPFPFPYYGESYAEVHVCNNGFIDLGGPFTDPDNSDAAMIAARRICPLWDDLRTDFGGRDVHIDASVAGEVTFRWDALQFPTFGVCNFSCTLFATGAIQFDYGVPNTNLTPTVGVSAGDGARFVVSGYSGQRNLSGVDSIRFVPGGGLPDGMTLSTDGILSGTPTETGAFIVTVRLTDALGGFDERDFTVVVGEPSPCPADVSGAVGGVPDGVVDVADLVYVITQWGVGGDADFTGADGVPDGTVDVQELVAVITAWGDC